MQQSFWLLESLHMRPWLPAQNNCVRVRSASCWAGACFYCDRAARTVNHCLSLCRTISQGHRCRAGLSSRRDMTDNAEEAGADRNRVRALRDLLSRADADILSAATEAEAARISDKAHADAGDLLHAWRFDDNVSFNELLQCCKEALKGLEAAVPLPPLPRSDPRAAPAARPQAAEATESADKDGGLPFDWKFLPTPSGDVISALKAGISICCTFDST